MSKPQDLSPRRNLPSNLVRTGGRPALPSNAALIKYIPNIERYAAGIETMQNKLAQHARDALVAIAARRVNDEQVSDRVKLAVAVASLKMADLLPGGAADDMPDSAFGKEELEKGVKHELEHTANRTVATEIAKDHLEEEHDEGKEKGEEEYYEKMEKMEKDAVDWGDRLQRLADRRGETLEELYKKTDKLLGSGALEDVRKLAGDEREPQVDDHQSAPSDKMRPRAEMILFNGEGVYVIDKGDYLLMPGGGVDDGEQPRDACIRETIEESNRHPINVNNAGVTESVWPENSGNEFWDNSEFNGERTYFFTGVDAGEAGITHADLEDFKVIPFGTVMSRLSELIADPKQEWAKRNNETRRKLVADAKRLAAVKSNLKPVKQAQVMPTAPVPQQPTAAIPQQPTASSVAPAPAAPAPAAGGAPLPSDMARQEGDPTMRAKDFVSSLTQSMQQGAPPQAPAPAAAPAPMPKAAANVGEIAIDDGSGAVVSPEISTKVQAGAYDPQPQASRIIQFAQQQPVERTDTQAMEGNTSGADQSKTADVASFKPMQQHLMFTPEGRLIARRLNDRRFAFPTEGTGKPAPYESDVMYTPETGIPDEGYHGYRIGLRVGESPNVPDGFEAVEPGEAIKEFYASMGLSKNKQFRQLDRARARAIIRYLKRKKQEQGVAGATP